MPVIFMEIGTDCAIRIPAVTGMSNRRKGTDRQNCLP